MPLRDPSERYLRSAVLAMLWLAVVGSAAASLMHWLSPGRQPMDLILPPAACVVFSGLLIALHRRPTWILAITRLALLIAAIALMAPSWLYTGQALLTQRQLIAMLPPTPPLLIMLVVMVMILFPPRRAVRLAVLAWLLIALPVLLYLLAHPAEMATPRGHDLLMTYGPTIIVVMVMLPIQQGLSGKIDRLVSERARLETSLNRDPLTRIHNRRRAEKVLRDAIATQHPAGVIMFDMDHFKAINDTYGHPAGDRVLQIVALRCGELLQQDECLSRWGGEEFLIVVPDTDGAGLRRLADQLRLRIAATTIEPLPQVTASFGISMIRQGDSVEDLLQRVDQALYRAKQRGRNCVMN